MKIKIYAQLFPPLIHCRGGKEAIYSKTSEVEMTHRLLHSIVGIRPFLIDGTSFTIKGYGYSGDEDTTIEVSGYMEVSNLRKEYSETLCKQGWTLDEKLARKYHLEVLLPPDLFTSKPETPSSSPQTPFSDGKSPPYFPKDPVCPRCGRMGVRAGACFKCPSCGESINCS
jgi:hypothetical protein